MGRKGGSHPQLRERGEKANEGERERWGKREREERKRGSEEIEAFLI